jgi:DNA excision repair protein ERCC-6
MCHTSSHGHNTYIKMYVYHRQRRFFKVKDLHDLFTLGDDCAGGTETGDLFADVADEILPESNGSRTATPGSSKDSRSRDKGRSADMNSASRNGHSDRRRRGDDADESDREEERGESSSSSGKKDKGAAETKLLRNLLDQCGGVTSAISHDSIVNGITGTGIDSVSRAEAERIAKKAALALRQSANQRGYSDVSVPTWTGRSGLAGAPAVIRESGPAVPAGRRQRFGAVKNPDFVQQDDSAPSSSSISAPKIDQTDQGGFGSGATCGVSGVDLAPTSSADLLRRLRARNVDAADPAALMRMDEADEAESWALLIMHELQTFFMSRSNLTANTQDVLNNFKITVPAHR